MIELMRNGGSADVFLHGEYGFSSVVNYCYSGEWLWNSRAKVCCMASGKKNASRISLQEFGITYIVFLVKHFERVSVF